jgi:hypothetical protein
MKFVGILFVFFGYTLVYASVAAGGKYATEPWAGMFADAYTAPLYPPGTPTANAITASGGNPNQSQAGVTPGIFNTPTGPRPYTPPPGIPVVP